MKRSISQKRIIREEDGTEIVEEMVLIPADEFEMGTDSSEIPQLMHWARELYLNAEPQIEIFERETPRHVVYLDDFYIDAYEVTNAQYREFTEATGYHEPKGYHCIHGEWQEIEPWNDPKLNDPNQPVVCVMWYDAFAYCQWVGKRLPTEAEWEKAARGGLVGKRYVWGDDPPDGSQANLAYKKMHSHQYTTPVGNFPANNYGLYDMAGNVWEWCSDWFHSDYYEKSPKGNPKGPSLGEERVTRGGSWFQYMSCGLRVADRSFDTPPAGSSAIIGFRCAKDFVTL